MCQRWRLESMSKTLDHINNRLDIMSKHQDTPPLQAPLSPEKHFQNCKFLTFIKRRNRIIKNNQIRIL